MSSSERWKAVPGFPYYEVSTIGRVRRISSGRILTVTKNTGQVCLGLGEANKRLTISPANLMLRAFKRAPKKGEIARHLDDDRNNNKLSNLAWGTHDDNMKDAIRNGSLGPGSIASMLSSVRMQRRWDSGEMQKLDWGAVSEKVKEAHARGDYAHVDKSESSKKMWKNRKEKYGVTRSK
jgi:hypothetical protein